LWIKAYAQNIYFKKSKFVNMATVLETNLTNIAQLAIDKTAENDDFMAFIKRLNSDEVDASVHAINLQISPQIDCTACGNCCNNLLININDDEANALSQHLQQSRESFDEKYVEKGSNGMMLMNTIPCHFLTNNKCTVYEFRFEGCREFPAMHLPNFNKRLFTTFMHYGKCPIIYNVVEQLKTETNFK
jgi:hypothetical protein